MSDFDKEAERERLREKYEDDKAEREATEQMSELLLQGATMTNAHCSDCGDPIFRYDGQEFCPTCEKAVDRPSGGEEAAENGSQDGIEVTAPDDDQRVAFGGPSESAQPADGSPAAGSERQPRQTQPGEEPDRATQQPDGQERAAPPRTEQPAADASRERSPARRRRDAGPAAAGEGIPAARDALVASLVRFSEQAAATDDPRRARDSLAAAREAAEALSALER